MRVVVDGDPLEDFRYYDGFRLLRNNRPRFFDRGPGTHEVQAWSDGPLPIPKATLELAGDEVALVEVFPATRCLNRRRETRIDVYKATID